MLRLYYATRTRASRVRWTLEELGVPYELTRLNMAEGEHKRPDYLQVHPLGQIPALQDGDQTIWESLAICLYLADRFPEKGLAPPLGQRAAYYQWSVYLIGTLEPPLVQFFLHTMRYPEEKRNPQIAEESRSQVLAALAPAERHLTGRQFVTDSFSVADVLLGSGLNWCSQMGLLKELPNLDAYAARMRERPAYQRASAD